MSALLRRFPARWDATFLGAGAALLCIVGGWIPSLWRDEAATVYIVEHSPTWILQLLHHTDAVFGLYYMGMHWWTALFGISALALRIPSALGVGAAVAGVVLAGKELHGRTLGVVSGIVLLLLPRMTQAGIEARPYALSAAATVWALVFALKCVHAPSVRNGVGLAFCGILASGLHLYALLAVLTACGGTLLLTHEKRPRAVLAGATGAITLASIPLIWLGQSQMGTQLDWLVNTPTQLGEQVAVEQYFPFRTDSRFLDPHLAWVQPIATLLAMLCWAVVLWLATTGWAHWRRPLLIGGLGVVVPTALVAAASLLTPTYTPRYLTATAPAMALLLAAALLHLRRSALRGCAAALMVGLIVPIFFTQRIPTGKLWMDDYSFIAHTVSEHAHTGDAILFEAAAAGGTESGRNATAAYPHAFRKVDDLSTRTQRTHPTSPWPRGRALETYASHVPQHKRVWLVTTPTLLHGGSPLATFLQAAGYRRTNITTGPAHAVTLWIRDTHTPGHRETTAQTASR